MLIKQNVNNLIFCFIVRSNQCQENHQKIVTGNIWVNVTHKHLQQLSSIKHLQSEQMTFLNLTKYNFDNILRCQNETEQIDRVTADDDNAKP